MTVSMDLEEPYERTWIAEGTIYPLVSDPHA
jgi:hypothetical protein